MEGLLAVLPEMSQTDQYAATLQFQGVSLRV